MDTAWLDEFATLAAERVQALETNCLALERQGACDASEELEDMMREAHALKGESAMLGLHAIKDLAHTLESVLVRLNTPIACQSCTKETVDAILGAIDTLRTACATPADADACNTHAAKQKLETTLAELPR